MGCGGSKPAENQVAPSYPADEPAAKPAAAKPAAVTPSCESTPKATPTPVPDPVKPAPAKPAAETKPAADAYEAPTGYADPTKHARVPAPEEDDEEPTHDPDRKRSNSVVDLYGGGTFQEQLALMQKEAAPPKSVLPPLQNAPKLPPAEAPVPAPTPAPAPAPAPSKLNKRKQQPDNGSSKQAKKTVVPVVLEGEITFEFIAAKFDTIRSMIAQNYAEYFGNGSNKAIIDVTQGFEFYAERRKGGDSAGNTDPYCRIVPNSRAHRIATAAKITTAAKVPPRFRSVGNKAKGTGDIVKFFKAIESSGVDLALIA